MNRLEEIANKIELEITKNIPLNKEQIINLIGTWYLYQNLNIKQGSFHEEKYKTYDLLYLAKEIQKGKTPLEIMNLIIDECEDYSRKKIMTNHLKETRN